MNTDFDPAALHGIIPPLATPLHDNQTLDIDGLERLIEHVIGGGVSGIFLLGTTGEGVSLGAALKRDFIRRAIAFVAGRVPVLVGVTDTSLFEAQALAGFAATVGAQAVVAAPPPYYPLTQGELIEYLRRLSTDLPIPLFLYNMPSHSHVVIEPETVRLAMEIPGIVGIKDSGGNMRYFHRLARLIAENRPDFTLLVGPEDLLAESVLLGGSGAVCAGANVHPRLYVDLYDAARRGDLGAVADLHRQVVDFASRIYTVGKSPAATIQGIKCALGLLGICDGALAPPLSPLDGVGREAIARHLDALGIRANASTS